MVCKNLQVLYRATSFCFAFVSSKRAASNNVSTKTLDDCENRFRGDLLVETRRRRRLPDIHAHARRRLDWPRYPSLVGSFIVNYANVDFDGERIRLRRCAALLVVTARARGGWRVRKSPALRGRKTRATTTSVNQENRGHLDRNVTDGTVKSLNGYGMRGRVLTFCSIFVSGIFFDETEIAS